MTLTLLLLVIGSAILFAVCAPQLGAVVKHDRTNTSPNYRDGKFHNTVTTTMKTISPEMWEATKEQFTGKQIRVPKVELPTVAVDPTSIGKAEETRVTWLGHSTLLIEIDGKVLLTDPVFSDRASPFSFMGPKRFPAKAPLKPHDVPYIDAVLISHDHYDHLDHQSILQLKEKTERFYVPLGVGGHLERWGVDSNKIVEFDWWQEQQVKGLTLVLTPTCHFSGRGLRRDRTLWGSWVIAGKSERLFFGGDSGFFSGFKEIGDKYGPFDLTMLESGAYNVAWSEIHMMPEETVQAHIDLKGKLLMPIHWGKFSLSTHNWFEPIERLLAAAEQYQVTVSAPVQGESVAPQTPPQLVHWWEAGKKKEATVITGRFAAEEQGVARQKSN